MSKIVFNNSGTYELGEVNTDELAFLAIQSKGFHIDNDEYAISFNPSEGFYFVCYDSPLEFHTYDIQCLVSKLMEVIEAEMSECSDRAGELRYQGAR